MPDVDASGGVAVVVPVMRHGLAEQFMESLLRSSPGLYMQVYAVAHWDDLELAKQWRAAGATIVGSPWTDMVRKVNRGFTSSLEPWVLFVGEDVGFHPGWDTAAMDAADSRFHVVGTNDLGHPKVLAGEHATHMLLRRSYVDAVGGGWGPPGVVMHEGYRHWFADDEIVLAAKQRGAWVAARNCVIEHLHPAWGKAADDDVYRLGASAESEDRAEFDRRFKLYGGAA